MLIKANSLKGYALESLDGLIGKVEEFYFDDQHWTIRYLIADTGNWLTGKTVLISPHALVSVDNNEKHIVINLSRKKIEGSPSINSDKPVSRQFEEQYLEYYGWPMYWGGPYNWGAYPYIVRDRGNWNESLQSGKAIDVHLRSMRDVSGHNIQAVDGDIGHVDDFLIDDETWAIRYLVIDTRNWWPGKKVLIPPQWVERVSWSESKVFVNLSRDSIKKSPEYTDELLLSRNYEVSLHKHYDRQSYWDREASHKTTPQ